MTTDKEDKHSGGTFFNAIVHVALMNQSFSASYWIQKIHDFVLIGVMLKSVFLKIIVSNQIHQFVCRPNAYFTEIKCHALRIQDQI